ncbi:DoxX family protein [Candidatus Uhrbacteria bacterium]|nr:DoxX family protein [Candidatus Uhrbacteria bacterium]
MWSHLRTPATTSLLLRIGLGVEFIIFGYGKLTDLASWIGFVPPWMSPLLPMPVGTFLQTVGVVELALGVLLIVGLWVRVIAVLSALHLLGVLIALGYNDLAVRDFVAFAAALALASLGPAGCHYSIDGRRTRNPKP